MPAVMPIHNGKNGVPGNNQNIQHVVATPTIVPPSAALPTKKAIAPMIYGIHTSHDITATTIINITNVRQSFKFCHIHLNGATIICFIFCRILSTFSWFK